MKNSLCWLAISVLTLSVAGCNHGWPGLFCRQRAFAATEAYEGCEPCDPCTNGYAPATAGAEWRSVPSAGAAETLPLPGPATTVPATR